MTITTRPSRTGTADSTQTGTTEPTPATSLAVRGAMHPRFDEVLTPAALAFVQVLAEEFTARRDTILAARAERQQLIDAGADPDFLTDTAAIRADREWRVAPPAPGLADRRCEITGPASRKMTVGALNSGATVWMADLEDATAPTWFNVIDSQVNLADAIRSRIDFTEGEKRYAIGETTPTSMMRPRGWHLDEAHLTLSGAAGAERAVPASLVDFGLHFFHNARALVESGRGPYFYLPKLESHLEARLWNDVFTRAQIELGLPHGTIRATVLIETLPAAFEMDEILYELRDHSAGLNAGRWDYIFSMIKTMGHRRTHLFPDRSEVTMTAPFMRAYTDLLVRTCHARGAHAIGGMAAFVPSRNDPHTTAAALQRTRADKSREATDGFDGSWVAHPQLVGTCLDAFTEVLGQRPHQLGRTREDVVARACRLRELGGLSDEVTLEGVRTNIRVSLEYLAAWLDGRGAVAIDHLMEDAATVEISRMQLWQWIRHAVVTAEGMRVTAVVVRRQVDQEVQLLARGADAGARERLDHARDLLLETCLPCGETGRVAPFVTTPAYARHLVETR
ncbi:MAG: malate synthase A [Propionibacteriaceae bacterium]